MKKHLKTSCLTVFIASIACGACGELTNYVFLTSHPVGRFNPTNEPALSRPAKDDSAGNWGAVSNSMQVSVRFAKKSFRSGEPVVATVLVRNTGEEAVEFFTTLNPNYDFVVVLEYNGHELAPKRNLPRAGGAGRTLTLYSKTQHKHEINLDDRFDLTAKGSYSIRIRWGGQRIGQLGWLHASSGTAVFTIED